MSVLPAKSSSNDLKIVIHPCDIVQRLHTPYPHLRYSKVGRHRTACFHASLKQHCRHQYLGRKQRNTPTHVYADQIRVHVCAFLQ